MRVHTDHSGYALVLAMMALVALTLLGIAAMSVADVDLTITHNIRRYHQAFNAANAGLDQAKQVSHDVALNPAEIASLNASAAMGLCDPIIDASTYPSATALETGGWPAAVYSVERCYAECGGIPLGYEMAQGINQGSGESMRDVYLDVQSTGEDQDSTRTRSPAKATTAGFLRMLGYCH